MEPGRKQPSRFQGRPIPKGARPVGWAALVQALGVPAPVRRPSCVSEGHVGKNRRAENGFRVFDKRYHPGDRLTDHLSFALRREDIDLLVLKRVFDAMPRPALEAWIRDVPTGRHTRRAWFFHELLTGRTLDVEDASGVTAVDALDGRACFTGKPRLSRRHRVRDNLLGGGEWCPVIRRTGTLESFIELELSTRAAETVEQTGRHLAARAAGRLLLTDSRASFEIEGERPPRRRLEQWSKAVLEAVGNRLTLDEIVRLHGILIKDMRFVFPGLRPDGVFVGERDGLNNPLPRFIGARPEDLESLCAGLVAANRRMGDDGVDPVLQAAATSFGFVHVHPFQDGNGRMHRCLIHHVLTERGYSPPGMVFPVSSVMLDRPDDYLDTLKAHSAPLMDFIEWRPTDRQNVQVLNDTADLYRYFDCTAAAEFLYSCVRRAVERDLPRAADHLRRHDEAARRITEMIDMPDHLARSLILFTRRNDGALSKRKRKRFPSLTDAEARAVEKAVRDVFAGFDDAKTRGK